MGKKELKSKKFFIEFIVGFGFLSGLWLAIGIDPQAEIFKILQFLINYFFKNQEITFWSSMFFYVFPTLTLIISLILIYRKAKWWGFIAVGLGFLAGVSILASPFLAIILLIISFLLGFFAT